FDEPDCVFVLGSESATSHILCVGQWLVSRVPIQLMILLGNFAAGDDILENCYILLRFGP
uniref:hypothetical protein n=1 Tax=Alistipes shahii TaxID=328814 RepID=UPI003AB14939